MNRWGQWIAGASACSALACVYASDFEPTPSLFQSIKSVSSPTKTPGKVLAAPEIPSIPIKSNKPIPIVKPEPEPEPVAEEETEMVEETTEDAAVETSQEEVQSPNPFAAQPLTGIPGLEPLELRQRYLDMLQQKVDLMSDHELQSALKMTAQEIADLRGVRLLEEARRTLQQLVKAFPGTPAGEEARRMLAAAKPVSASPITSVSSRTGSADNGSPSAGKTIPVRTATSPSRVESNAEAVPARTKEASAEPRKLAEPKAFQEPQSSAKRPALDSSPTWPPVDADAAPSRRVEPTQTKKAEPTNGRAPRWAQPRSPAAEPEPTPAKLP